MKTVGFYSFKTNKTYKTASARKTAETKLNKKEFSNKLEELQAKYGR